MVSGALGIGFFGTLDGLVGGPSGPKLSAKYAIPESVMASRSFCFCRWCCSISQLRSAAISSVDTPMMSVTIFMGTTGNSFESFFCAFSTICNMATRSSVSLNIRVIDLLFCPELQNFLLIP